MKTISQRELRNDNAEVMRAVEQGESYTVTRRGVPVAVLSPIAATSQLQILRPARSSKADFRKYPRVDSSETTASILDELRGER